MTHGSSDWLEGIHLRNHDGEDRGDASKPFRVLMQVAKRTIEVKVSVNKQPPKLQKVEVTAGSVKDATF